MDLNLITHWQPQPGRVVAWKVSDDDARAAAQTPVDPAPPTTMQERHLRRARLAANNNEAQSPWIGIAYNFDGQLDAAAMARVLQRYVARHDTLHSWFSFADPAADPTDKSNAIQRHVVSPEHFTLEVTDGPVLESTEQARDYVATRFADETSALGWPAFVFGAIEFDESDSAPSGFTLFHAIDHAHTDMQSMILMFAEIRLSYEAEINGTTTELPDPGSYVEYSIRERERAASLTLETPEVQAWLGYLARTGGSFPGFPLELGVADGPARAIGSRFDLADAVECEQFGAICKAHGSNFIGGIFAALAITEHELAGRDRYLAMTPFTTRGEKHFWSQGWFINLVPVAFELEGAKTFTDLTGAAQQAYRDGKALGDVSAQQVIETVLAQAPALAAAAPTALTPPPILSYIDGRRLPDTESYISTKATGLVGGKDTEIASIWVNRVLGGTWMAVSHPDTEIAHASVSTYANRVSEIMKTVAREGDYRIRTAGQ